MGKSDEINLLEAKISTVEQDIDHVIAEIVAVESEIKLEKQREPLDKTTLLQLRKKEEQLRKKKEQLHKKEEQLRLQAPTGMYVCVFSLRYYIYHSLRCPFLTSISCIAVSASTTIKGLGKAIREVPFVPVHIGDSRDVSIRHATLPPSLQWFFVIEGSSELVIRPCYETVWDVVKSTYLVFLAEIKKGNVPPYYRRILIVGNPGIGKTASMNYHIAMALRENYPVLVETRDD